MTGRFWIVLLGVAALASGSPRSALAAGSDNHVLHAVPAPGKVTIDGNLEEWDQSGRILVCSDVEHALDQFSGWVSMMYDAEALYVGVDWNDPTPLVNDYDPDLDIDRRKCFHSDSLQLHLRTDETRKVIGWYYSKQKRPGVIVLNGWNPWGDKPIVYIDGQKDLGIQEAFQVKKGGRGYTQELRIPWKAIVKSGHPYQPGESFDCMLDLVWGPDNGKGWPVNHMMDLVAPGAVHTGWFWEVREIYGKVELSAKGHLNLPPPAFMKTAERPKIAGTIPLRLAVPQRDGQDPNAFTLAINDAAGQRVRSLPGDCRVADYRAADNPRQVEVAWDGLDDRGRLAPPGKYQIVGLTRGPITPRYDLCFYNPGNPPWATADGTGGWGADHTPPVAVAAAGDSVVIGWGGAEGGSGIIGVNAQGNKTWGQTQGLSALAADDQYAYFMLNDFWAGKKGLARLNRKDGSYQPFHFAGKPLLPVPLESIFTDKAPGEVRGLAVARGQLAISLSSGTIALLEADTAKLLKTFAVKDAGPLAFDAHGALYALAGGAVHQIDLQSGAARPLDLAGVKDPRAIATDRAGNILVADMGPDSQVKAFSPAGKLLYTVGKPGGRALRGPFDPHGITHVSSIAVDARDQIWTVEDWDNPRRVSVWNKQGQLVRDYIGNAAYSASGTYLHDQDPTLAYSGPVEMKLDRAAHRWSISQVLWLPDRARHEGFPIGGGLSQPQRFTSTASGKAHEYLFVHAEYNATGYVIYMLRNNHWQPVAAVGLVKHVLGGGRGATAKEPADEFAGLDANDGCFWNDANGDGMAQRGECEIVAAKKTGAKETTRPAISTEDGWGSRVGRDLSIYSNGLVRYQPTKFSADGAPQYGVAGMHDLGVADRGDIVPIEEDHTLVILSSTGYGETSYLRGLEFGTWREQWRYPSYAHGVHGSHHASMPEPGKILGALKITGTAKVNDRVGSVLAIRGNLGQDYLLTSDGLFVGTVFRDSRLPGPSLPAKEADLRGQSVAELTEGGEPFNGWFGRQSDGKIRMLTGIPGQAGMIVQIDGLDSIERFTGPTIDVDEKMLVAAAEANATRATVAAARKQYTIKKAPQPLDLRGGDEGWRTLPALEISRKGAPEHAQAKLAYDDQQLYLRFDVFDASPWKNSGVDAARLFKTGDAIDLQFSTNAPAAADKTHADKAHAPQQSDVRLLIAPLAGKATCVLMKPVDKQAAPDQAYDYRSPVGVKHFDRVEVLEDAAIHVKVEKDRYRVEAAIPWKRLAWVPAAGATIRGEAGFISSNAEGTIDVARTYWSNPATNLTNDLPSEAWLYPNTWGEWKFESP
ncbi:MAG TPA: hypothetical protein VFE24_07705 [Pirellulales bacterium]|nr:hypothetical protein [Pirellulales bacterium]